MNLCSTDAIYFLFNFEKVQRRRFFPKWGLHQLCPSHPITLLKGADPDNILKSQDHTWTTRTRKNNIYTSTAVHTYEVDIVIFNKITFKKVISRLEHLFSYWRIKQSKLRDVIQNGGCQQASTLNQYYSTTT